MAFWVLGGGSGPSPPDDDARSWQHHDMRQKTYPLPFDHHSQHQPAPQQTYHDTHTYHNDYSHQDHHGQFGDRRAPPSIQIKNLAFLVIREQHPDSPPPDAPCADLHAQPGNGFHPPPAPPQRPPAVERTESGLAISESADHAHGDGGDDGDDEDEQQGGPLLDDLAAAQLVRDHVASFHRRCPDSQHARILRALIQPKSDTKTSSPHNNTTNTNTNATSSAADTPAFPLDNDALTSVFSAANELFFANRLARRVAWDWSHPGSPQYRSAVVGTTALRRSARLGGWETLIVLSSPVLRDTRYNRRLLLSTFLHEMIHSFLFVTCGRKAGRGGGHTEGFRQIAEVIDAWVGREHLRLGDMEADLKYFEDGSGGSVPATPCLGYGRMVGEQQHPPRQQQQQQQQHTAQREAVPAWQLDSERNVWPNRGPEAHGMHLHEPVLPPPQQYRHPDDGAWQWYEREGFEARDGPMVGYPY